MAAYSAACLSGGHGDCRACLCACHDQGRPTAGELVSVVRFDGQRVTVTPQLYGAAIITLGPADGVTYTYQWMYSADVDGVIGALVAAAEWLNDEAADEPEGWVRSDYHAPPGLWRRRPDGDRAREEVRA